MRKLLLSLFSSVLAMAASAQSYYATDFSSEEEFGKWTVIDANGDGATWQYDTSGSYSNVFYPYHSTNAGDDWLISPAITPTADGKVMVSYTTWGTYYGEAMDVYTGTDATVEGMTTLQASYANIKGENTPGYFFYEVKKDTPFRVGFHCVSAADHWKFYMCSFAVKVVEKVVDLKVDSILSPVSGKNLSAETVTVRVKNDGMEAAPGFDVAYTIDGGAAVTEHVGTTLEAGQSMTYTFATKADLSQPRHKYNLKAYSVSEYDIAPANDTLAVAVRHSAPTTAPYTMGFESSEDTDELKFYNLNEDSGDWSVYTSYWMNMARNGYACLAYNYDSTHDADDWAILDGINVEAGDYVLRYWYSGSDGHKERLGVYYGNGDTPDDMTHKVDEQNPVTEGAYKESFKILHFDEPQTIYLGFYCFSDKDENWLTVDDVQFYKASSDAVDLVVSEISKPYDYVRTPNDKDVTFEVKNVGIKDTKGTITVSVDGEQKASVALDIVAQEIKSLTAPNALVGLSAGKHTLKVSVASDDDNDDSNNTVEKEIVVLGEPTVMYDFEDAKIPDTFDYYVGDGGTINADAGEEFNEQGWGIIDVESHAMYGNHVLAGTSWIDGVSNVDRWVILPQVKVSGSNCYLAWDASSGNPNYLETYKVKISDGSGNPADYWYSTSKEVKDESIYPKTRGIDLSKYAGKDIYIAFDITSEPGEFLVLDNIGIYGDANLVPTGITDTEAATSAIVVSGNEISSAAAEKISVADLSGRTVLSVDGQKADVSALHPGVYVAIVKTGAGQHSLRFVKK